MGEAQSGVRPFFVKRVGSEHAMRQQVSKDPGVPEMKMKPEWLFPF